MPTPERGGTQPTPDGILVVDKPQGWTSHDVVARARECGARGFVPKDDLSAAALDALLE